MMKKLEFPNAPSPCYIIDESALIKNLEILESVRKRTGCKILLAQKAFSMYKLYPLISKYLDGTTASGIYEARLGFEEMGKEVHVFAPAFSDSDFNELLKYCNHIVLNSFSQWKHFKTIAKQHPEIEFGLRVNPEYSEIETEIYNPCAENSRMGITLANFEESELDGISGLHFHTMCEQNSDALKHTIPYFEEKFGKYLKQMKWVNFGGGHHITRHDYDIETLVKCIDYIQNKYDVTVYLEPGEAVALNAGYLLTTVLDIVNNGMDIAIIDASAACHMPDVLEMPYRPEIIGAGKAGEKKYTYRLAAPTCLAGDIVSDYSFDEPLKIGDRLLFCDMAIYTMVKNNTFNGMPLPSIAISHENGDFELWKKFGYEDFKQRL